MISKRFEYHAPRSLEQAVALAEAKNGDAVLLGGGTWVVPDMTHGLLRPAHVIDLRHAALSGVDGDAGGLRIGAMTTYTELSTSPLVAERAGALTTMAEGITGGAQVRNRGTIGGSVCYALPSADAHGALVGLGARLRLASSSGTREIDAERFYLDSQSTALEPGEILSEILVPEPPPSARFGYVKFKLCESSWPIATACCVLGMGDGGTIASARLGLGAVGTTPYVVDLAPLIGEQVTPDTAAEVARLAEQAVTSPYGDALASGEYRKQIAGVIAKRALLAAAA